MAAADVNPVAAVTSRRGRQNSWPTDATTSAAAVLHWPTVLENLLHAHGLRALNPEAPEETESRWPSGLSTTSSTTFYGHSILGARCNLSGVTALSSEVHADGDYGIMRTYGARCEEGDTYNSKTCQRHTIRQVDRYHLARRGVDDEGKPAWLPASPQYKKRTKDEKGNADLGVCLYKVSGLLEPDHCARRSRCNSSAASDSRATGGSALAPARQPCSRAPGTAGALPATVPPSAPPTTSNGQHTFVTAVAIPAQGLLPASHASANPAPHAMHADTYRASLAQCLPPALPMALGVAQYASTVGVDIAYLHTSQASDALHLSPAIPMVHAASGAAQHVPAWDPNSRSLSAPQASGALYSPAATLYAAHRVSSLALNVPFHTLQQNAPETMPTALSTGQCIAGGSLLGASLGGEMCPQLPSAAAPDGAAHRPQHQEDGHHTQPADIDKALHMPPASTSGRCHSPFNQPVSARALDEDITWIDDFLMAPDDACVGVLYGPSLVSSDVGPPGGSAGQQEQPDCATSNEPVNSSTNVWHGQRGSVADGAQVRVFEATEPAAPQPQYADVDVSPASASQHATPLPHYADMGGSPASASQHATPLAVPQLAGPTNVKRRRLDLLEEDALGLSAGVEHERALVAGVVRAVQCLDVDDMCGRLAQCKPALLATLALEPDSVDDVFRLLDGRNLLHVIVTAAEDNHAVTGGRPVAEQPHLWHLRARVAEMLRLVHDQFGDAVFDALLCQAEDEHESTPLIRACRWGYPEVVDYLMPRASRRALLSRTSHKWLAPHSAARSGHRSVAAAYIRRLEEVSNNRDVVQATLYSLKNKWFNESGGLRVLGQACEETGYRLATDQSWAQINQRFRTACRM